MLFQDKSYFTTFRFKRKSIGLFTLLFSIYQNKSHITQAVKKRHKNFQFLVQDECFDLINIINNRQQMQNNSQSPCLNLLEPPSQSRLGGIKKKLSLQLKQILVKNKMDAQQFQKQSPSKNKTYTNLEQIKCMKDTKSQAGFFHQYQIGKKLGEGCHSSVFKCQSKKQNKSYAVKVTKQKDLQLFQSMRQSYRILKKLQHQNIIQTKNLFINQRVMTCHLVLQYCQWPNLDYYIKQKQCRFQKQEVAHIIGQLLKTVAYLHNSGVCHRDLKPDNILYNREKRKIKIIDFQIARMKKYLNLPLQMMSKTGFLSYRAPEIFHAIYDQRVDIWALGVIAYQLLTLQLPFFTQNQNEQINKILHQQPDYSELGVWQQDLLKMLLAKNPQNRATVKQALSCPFLLMNSKVSDSPPSKAQVMVKSPSLGKKDFQQSFKQNDFSSKFYDDQVTNLFLGANQGDIGVIREQQF